MSEEMSALPCIVIDVGSSTAKVGFSSSDTPKVLSEIATVRPQGHSEILGFLLCMQRMQQQHSSANVNGLCRQHIASCAGICSWPVDRGIVTNWEVMEQLWQDLYATELSIPQHLLREHLILISETALQPDAARERTAEVHFESFQVGKISLQYQGVLALYGSGRCSGTVLDCGGGVSEVLSIWEGYYLEHATKRLELGGRDLTEYMQQLLQNEGVTHLGLGRAQARSIKEGLGYIEPNFGKAAAKNQQGAVKKGSNTYTLPDGCGISLSNDACARCPELLFQPLLDGNQAIRSRQSPLSLVPSKTYHKWGRGVHEAVYESIMLCDIDMRGDLCANIVCCGGPTMHKGFPERLGLELKMMTPSLHKLSVVAPQRRDILAWKGGSALTNVWSIPCKNFISKEEYEDCGMSVVRRKSARRLWEFD